ncbi:uncharacterized protein TRAVEDRAFT_162573 [Trametes versicolor FP-101664 SS1]|uniref:uncharacterized protein n=1 Tax=Trametes versicolor (strain FP-101664) TaxID=717944 RepID=UPI000462332A|nr:uncharacterized protein TRAVEDRAFT_162573 [Trametes versicolor FP-101664 SS1]EIW61420.1 hypothetical protein TRAVEDRAFT_162573 [Trametes versicolor FP-101664 SS1]
MPQVYRRHSDYNPRTPVVPRRRSSMAPPGPQPTDADDSIVLADLVRTGEASRLRRRGAMRLDHGPTAPTRVPIPSASTAGPSSYAPSARPIIIEPSRTPSPELNPDDNGGDEYTYTAGPAWRGVDAFPSRDSGRAEGVQTVEILSENIQAGQSYILYCGGEDAALSDDEEDERPPPFQPSLFPIMPPAGGRSSRPQRKSIRKTNGCGALVHVRAYPQRPRGVWMAKEEASETVVGLDAQYCDHSSMDKMLKSACGCIREGIGCSVCGNTLGTRYVPCQAASESFFSPSPSASAAAPPPRPMRPFGPSYWNARPASQHRQNPSGPSRVSPSSYYTFFADRVSSSPPCQPSHTSAVFTPEMSRRAPSRAGSPEVIDYGYRWTASPIPAAAVLPSGDTSASSNFVTTPLSPVFTLPPLPAITRTPSQMRPPSAPIRVPRVALDIRSADGALGNSSGESGLQLGMDVDPDGVPLVDMEVPGSPDKEGMSWPGR